MRITQFDIQIATLCGNMCEEGAESEIWFRGRIERFRTLGKGWIYTLSNKMKGYM